jgi:hypothetical protein
VNLSVVALLLGWGFLMGLNGLSCLGFSTIVKKDVNGSLGLSMGKGPKLEV